MATIQKLLIDLPLFLISDHQISKYDLDFLRERGIKYSIQYSTYTLSVAYKLEKN